jgi:integrase/recombinase XerD
MNAIRLRALVLLLRYSGLRLGDAVTISRDRIENGTLILRTEKTGTLVRLPLPQKVVDAIAACPGPRYPFWSGNGKRKSVVTDWQRALKRLLDIAGVREGARPQVPAHIRAQPAVGRSLADPRVEAVGS